MKLNKVVLIGLFFTILACSCLAEDYHWNNTSGGSFGDPGNWSPNGVPGIGDLVFFWIPPAYTTTFENDYTTDSLWVDYDSDVRFDLNGYSYSLDYAPDLGPAVIVGGYGTGTLTINHGFINSKDVVLGRYSGSTGNLSVAGSDAGWTTNYEEGWHGAWIGQDGSAHLSILYDSQFNHGHGNSALSPESNVVVDINGLYSQWYVDGQFDMSINGKTTVNNTNGGLVEMGKLTMGYYPGSSAQINLSGISHQTELVLHAGRENSLAIGKGGKAGIQVDGSKVLNQGSMTIAENPGSTGLLDMHNSSWVDCWESAAIGGTLTTPGGTGQVKITYATFTPANRENESVVVWPQGTITMDDGQLITIYADEQANPIVLKGGTLEGNGMIWGYVENRGGIVAPNDDQDNKVLDVEYNYMQDASGTLKIAIGGQEPVTQYSHLRVTHENFGQVSLDGMLDVDLTDGFVPSYDDQFIIIAARNISGTFSNAVTKYVFKNGSFDVIYDSSGGYGSVILTHYSPEPACSKYPLADINKDCTVDLKDFAIFASEWLECNLVPDSYCFGGGPILL